MAKINVDIVVPTEYIPPDDLDYAHWEQFLTFSLASYFPRAVEEIHDTHPYLNDLYLERKDIAASYRADSIVVRNGWWIVIHISKQRPSQQAWVDLKRDIELKIDGWFRSKHYKNPRMSVELRWKDDP